MKLFLGCQSYKMKQCKKRTMANKKERLQKCIASMKRDTDDQYQKDFSKISQSNWAIIDITIEFGPMIFLMDSSYRKTEKISCSLWNGVVFAEMVKQRSLLFMNISKSTIKRISKTSWRVSCFPGPKEKKTNRLNRGLKQVGNYSRNRKVP